MKRTMRARARKILLASTLALLGAMPLTHGQEATPVTARNTEDFPAGTQVTLGYAGQDGNVAVSPTFETYVKFAEICKAIGEVKTEKDSNKCTRATMEMVNSGELHLYKNGTPGTIVKMIPVQGTEPICVVRVEGKKWLTLGGDVHLPGTAPPVVVTPKEIKESPPTTDDQWIKNAEFLFRDYAKKFDNCDPANPLGMVQIINMIIRDAGTPKVME